MKWMVTMGSERELSIRSLRDSVHGPIPADGCPSRCTRILRNSDSSILRPRVKISEVMILEQLRPCPSTSVLVEPILFVLNRSTTPYPRPFGRPIIIGCVTLSIGDSSHVKPFVVSSIPNGKQGVDSNFIVTAAPFAIIILKPEDLYLGLHSLVPWFPLFKW